MKIHVSVIGVRGETKVRQHGPKKKKKNWLKTHHSKNKDHGTSWQIDGETVETVTDFIFLGNKSTADADGSHEIKRHLLLGRKAMTNLDNVLKNRDITLPTKVHLVKAMIVSSSHVWM